MYPHPSTSLTLLCNAESLAMSECQLCIPPLQAVGDSSHRWTAYVRSLDNEDISHVIKKVFLGGYSLSKWQVGRLACRHILKRIKKLETLSLSNDQFIRKSSGLVGSSIIVDTSSLLVDGMTVLVITCISILNWQAPQATHLSYRAWSEAVQIQLNISIT